MISKHAATPPGMLFPLGAVSVTRSVYLWAYGCLERRKFIDTCLYKHRAGYWGDASPDENDAVNDERLEKPAYRTAILSCHRIPETAAGVRRVLWIRTGHEQEDTLVMFPEELRDAKATSSLALTPTTKGACHI